MNRRPDDRRPGDPRRSPTTGARPGGPKPLSDILGDLFAARGLARVRALGELEAAWADAVGEPGRRQTRVDGLRRGVLSIIVAHPTLLAELASYQKPGLLTSLRAAMAGTPILDIRFRVGPVARDGPPPPPRAGPAATGADRRVEEPPRPEALEPFR